MSQRRNTRLAAVTAASMLALAGAAAFAPVSSANGADRDLRASLMALNDSGVHGAAEVEVEGGHVVDVELSAHGAAANLPHAQHIHFGEQARHECPTFTDDTDGDFRLTTADGVPAYGPIAVSLTTKEDTSPTSGLALDRMPVADEHGSYDYDRDVQIHDTDTQNAKSVARAIARGEGVVVIHGIDYNQNGEYDFDSAGASELDASAPAEATDPAACGVLMQDN